MKKEGYGSIRLKAAIFISLILLNILVISAATHQGSNIYLKVGNKYTTLQYAINNYKTDLCPGAAGSGSYSGSGGTINFGHTADQIYVLANNKEET
jgi:hypothetical protein